MHKTSSKNSTLSICISNLFVIICRLAPPTKVFLQLECHTELLTASSVKSI